MIINIIGLLCNASSSLVFGVFSSFLKSMGVNTADICFFQGAMDAFSFGMKLGAGFLSDFLKNRKNIIIAGIILMALSKFFLVVATSLVGCIAARALDRFGNGLQMAPRDALMGDLCPKNKSGTWYGARTFLTVTGSVIGSFFGMKLLMWTNGSFKTIFALAILPSIGALVLSILCMPDSFVMYKKEREEFYFKNFSNAFWKLMLVAFVFLMVRYGEAVVTMRTVEKLSLSYEYFPMFLIIFNLSSAVMAYPLGVMSDYCNKEKILLLSFVVAVIAQFWCAFSVTMLDFIFVTALWGILEGISNSIFFSLISNYATLNLRGTAFSVYFAVSLCATLVGSFIFRYLCTFGLHVPFIFGGIGSIAASVLLCYFFKDKVKIKLEYIV